MFIIAFFLEYILFFLLLVLLTIQLLGEYKQIIVKNNLYIPSIVAGVLVNFMFFDLFTDPILGARSSLLGLAAGFVLGIILYLTRFLTLPNFYTLLAICSFIGIYRFWGYLIVLLAIISCYFIFNLITKSRFLPKMKRYCSNGILVCISGIIYCIIVLI